MSRSVLVQLDLSTRALWDQNSRIIVGSTNGTNGLALNQLNAPLDLSVDKDMLYISDEQNHRVIMISLDGSKNASTIQNFKSPRGIVATHDALYVLHDRCTLEKLSLNGFNRTVVIQCSFDGSYYLFIDPANNVYLSVMIEHKVIRFRSDNFTHGELVAGNGKNGSSAQQFNLPYGIYVDDRGWLYVADCYNHRVMLWLPNATYGQMVAGNGVEGTGLNQLYYPTKVIVDSHGYIYVSESNSGRITRWASGSTYGVCIAGCRPAALPWNWLIGPHSLAFDHHGSLYVLERQNNRVQKFQILNYTGQTSHLPFSKICQA